VLYSDASVLRLEATAAASLGEQRLAADSAIFNTWLQAEAEGNRELQALLVRRLSPEYRAAFTAWLATDPFDDPDAPPGPGYMPEYHNPQIEKSHELNERAAEMEHEGTEARHTAEEYVRATVLFALVLFMVAIGQRFRLRGVRIATLVLALALFSYAFLDIATLPRL
jgi:hypothetical protein